MSVTQSALTRFPPEILGECFLFCVHERLLTIALDEAPVSLALVCRTWHDIALPLEYSAPLGASFDRDMESSREASGAYYFPDVKVPRALKGHTVDLFTPILR